VSVKAGELQSDVDSYVISCALATAGLVIGGIVASRIKMRPIGID